MESKKKLKINRRLLLILVLLVALVPAVYAGKIQQLLQDSSAKNAIHATPTSSVYMGPIPQKPTIPPFGPVAQKPTSIPPLPPHPTIPPVVNLPQSPTPPPPLGRAIYASPGDDLQTIASGLTPGDTLILHDGTYTGQLTASGLHGTASAPITIEAEHDGKVMINGSGEDHAILVQNSSYVTIWGFSTRNANEDLIYITYSDHTLLERITGANAGTGNREVFNVEYGNTNTTIEDCAGWGNGRYIFVTYHSTGTIFRRDWARWTSQSNFSPAPRACYGVYGSSNDLLENDICIHDIPDVNSNDWFTALWETTDGPPVQNNTFVGLIFMDNWDGFYVNDGENTRISNSLFLNTRQQGTYSTSQDHGYGVEWANDNGSVTNSTFVDNETGLGLIGGSTQVTNNTFVNNGRAVNSSPSGGANNFFSNGGGEASGSGNQQIDPGYNAAKYGRGAYLFVPPNSALKGRGANGSDIGANIIYEYENGNLTNIPLWPWPMEARIQAEAGISVTWEAGGGLWRTLAGVY